MYQFTNFSGNIGAFGKAFIAPPPAPPEDVAPTITPEEEQAILMATTPIPAPEPSFISRNATPLIIGGSVLTLGILGMILLVKV